MNRLFDLISQACFSLWLTVRAFSLFGWALVLALCGFAFAQATQPVELIRGVSPATITLLVIFCSSFLAHWLTALTKGRLGTEGRTTQLLAGGFSALTGGLITFRSGLYGEGWTALLVALLVSLVTWAAADAQWRGKVQAATAALQGLQQSGGLPNTVLPGPTSSPAPSEPSQVAQVSPAPAEPATALPSPAYTPAPVAAYLSGDPMILTLISLLSSALALGATAPTSGQAAALGTWADTWLPEFRHDVEALGTGITPAGVMKLVGDVIPAANSLQGTFKGLDRAEVVGVTVRFVVQEFAPAALQPILAPILASGVLEGVIEAKYRELFPEKPVVDAPELPSGEGIK